MSKNEDRKAAQKYVAQNRKARFEFEILEKLETGMVLMGSEVKSLRSGRMSLDEAYAAINERNEVYLINSHIPEYPASSIFNHEPKRKRKLLLHQAEIDRLKAKLKEKGLTLVPLSVYFKEGRAKLELGLAKGKKLFDKRQAIKNREDQKALKQAMSRRR